MYGRKKCDKIEKMKKFFRLFKYIALSIVFVLLALLRWGSNEDSSKDGKLSLGKDLKKLLPNVHADVPGGGGDDDDGGGGGDGGGGC